MRTLTKIAKDYAQEAADFLLKKYNCDEFSIDCTKMSDADYQIYIALDKTIQTMKQILMNEAANVTEE